MKCLPIRTSVIAVLATVVLSACQALPGSGTSGSTTQASTQTVLVSIPARRPWTDTGIDVTPGWKVSIETGGTIYISRDDPGTEPSGPAVYCKQPIRPKAQASDSSFVAPGLPCWSLIGRIGKGAPFEVGVAKALSTATRGRLYLGVNDQTRYFDDNSGSWTVTVSATRG